MKKMRLLFALAIAAITATSFTSSEVLDSKEMSDANCYFFVAVGSSSKDCNGLSVNYGRGYRYRYVKGRYDYNTEYDKIKKEVADYYSIETKNVYVKTASAAYASIVRYDHSLSGWGCTVTKYAVGFGNSEDAAEKSALNNRDSKSGSYSIVETIGCN